MLVNVWYKIWVSGFPNMVYSLWSYDWHRLGCFVTSLLLICHVLCNANTSVTTHTTSLHNPCHIRSFHFFSSSTSLSLFITKYVSSERLRTKMYVWCLHFNIVPIYHPNSVIDLSPTHFFTILSSILYLLLQIHCIMFNYPFNHNF